MKEKNKLLIESQAADTLLEKGLKFKVGMLRFTIKQSYLGTLIQISKYVTQIKLNDLQISGSGNVSTAYANVPENAVLLARIIAIAVLNGKLKIKLFSGLLSRFLIWRLNPERLLSLISVVIVLNNAGAFMNSIRLIHTLRMTAPKENLIEKLKD
jgi:hypothetical protein